MRQLIEPDEVKFLTLIFDLVLCVVQASEIDLSTAGKCPNVLAIVVLRPGKRLGIKLQALADQFRKLRESLSDDNPLVMGNMHLPQGFYDQAVTLAAPGSTPIKGFILRPLQKFDLFRLWCPYRFRHLLHPLPSLAAEPEAGI